MKRKCIFDTVQNDVFSTNITVRWFDSSVLAQSNLSLIALTNQAFSQSKLRLELCLFFFFRTAHEPEREHHRKALADRIETMWKRCGICPHAVCCCGICPHAVRCCGICLHAVRCCGICPHLVRCFPACALFRSHSKSMYVRVYKYKIAI